MRIIMRQVRAVAGLLVLAAVLTISVPTAARAQGVAPAASVDGILRDMPTGALWLDHLRENLLPFWEMETALGEPVGNFPTYRCNDGSLYDPDQPCPELANPVAGIVWLDREFVRAKSRQVFAYGIAFHLTGDTKYLEWARAGVDWIRTNALDRENGGAFTYFVGAEATPGPEWEERRSQDLAYAASSIGFYYYLTHDPAVLEDVLALGDFIYDSYYDAEQDLITWVKKPSPDGDTTDQKELVAQLDQVYGYMLWVTPALPEPHRSAWQDRLRHLARIMITQFYAPRENIFWGAITTPDIKRLGTDHTDFGHSVKTLWLIYQIGKMTGDLELTNFAAPRAARIVDTAYIPSTGSWARRIDGSGLLDTNKEWWILAELDQVAGTLALVDPYYARYLPATYSYWFTYMVDHEHGGVWHWVKSSDNKPLISFPKQHSWKNAFHTFEHALVGYLICQQLSGQPARLHYAFAQEPDPDLVHPYFYAGKKQAPATQSYEGVWTVDFVDIR